jgi:uncharacterized protein
MELVGRTEERADMQGLLRTGKSEFLAVYGRRRVGKTYLIREVYKSEMVFDMSGRHDAPVAEHLADFAAILGRRQKAPIPAPASWQQAFHLLIHYLESLKSKTPKVVFFDELPWLCSARSGFLRGLDHFWNTWASARTDIVLVVCGSAASWMIEHVVRNKGGLYNRLTRQMILQPFTLYEAETFLERKKAGMDRYQILQLYMVTGGIPHYLNGVEPGMSAAQAINQMCFTRNGLLAGEYDSLYYSLFNNADAHMNIIQALGRTQAGLTRSRLLAEAGLADAGSATRVLNELEQSGFIGRYLPFGKKVKESLFRLTDFYSAFYLRFMVNARPSGAGYWLKKMDSPAWRAFSGFAFENICFYHIPQIKQALGISGIHSEDACWFHKGTADEAGAQIDLLLDRADHIVEVLEMKFSKDVFAIDKQYHEALQKKLSVFRRVTGTRKAVWLAMVTTMGLQPNIYSNGYVQQQVDMQALFAESKPVL